MSERSKKVTEQDRRNIEKLANQGLRPAEIARRLGLPGRVVAGVYSQLRAAGKIRGLHAVRPGSRPSPTRVKPGPRSPGSGNRGGASPVKQTLNDIHALQENVNRAVDSTKTDDVLRAAGDIVEMMYGLSHRSGAPNKTNTVREVFSEIERLKQKDHWRKTEDEDRKRKQQREDEDRAWQQKEKEEKQQREYDKQLHEEQQEHEKAEQQRKHEEEERDRREAEPIAKKAEEKRRERKKEEYLKAKRLKAEREAEEAYDKEVESAHETMDQMDRIKRLLGGATREEAESLCYDCIWYDDETGYCDANFCKEYDDPDDFDGLAIDDPDFIIGPLFEEDLPD